MSFFMGRSNTTDFVHPHLVKGIIVFVNVHLTSIQSEYVYNSNLTLGVLTKKQLFAFPKLTIDSVLEIFSRFSKVNQNSLKNSLDIAIIAATLLRLRRRQL